MFKYVPLLTFFTLVLVFASQGIAADWSISNSCILKDGQTVFLKGIGFSPYMPCEKPENNLAFPKTDSAFAPQRAPSTLITKLADAHINTLRVYPHILSTQHYQMIKTNGFYILKDIWFEPNPCDIGYSGFQDQAFKDHVLQSYIIPVLNDLNNEGMQGQVLGFILGNELNANCVRTTNQNSSMNAYVGQYLSVSGVSPTEVFIAEMADLLITYAVNNLGWSRPLVGHANWRPLDPFSSTPMPLQFMDFVCFNLYTYGTSGNCDWKNYVTQLKQYYPTKPMLISECGLSTSDCTTPNGPPCYGYGCNTESGQSEFFHTRWADINSLPVALAGFIPFEANDEWWKGGDACAQDDVEDHFGIIAVEGTSQDYSIREKAAYHAIQNIFSQTYKLQEYAKVRMGGYMMTELNHLAPQDTSIQILAHVAPAQPQGQIEQVNLLYRGIPVGIELMDDGQHGDLGPDDGFYGYSIPISAGDLASMPASQFILEVNPVGSDCRKAPNWPYLNVPWEPPPVTATPTPQYSATPTYTATNQPSATPTPTATVDPSRHFPNVPECVADRNMNFLYLSIDAVSILGYVGGRACGKNSLPPDRLANEYCIVFYAKNFSWNRQIYMGNWQLQIENDGYWEAYTGVGTENIAYLVRKDYYLLMPFYATDAELPDVDGQNIIAKAKQ